MPAASTSPPRASESVLPEPSIECPELVDGQLTVRGVTIDVMAGTRPEAGVRGGPMLIVWHGNGADGRVAIDLVPESVRHAIRAMGGVIIALTGGGEARAGEPVVPTYDLFFTSDFELVDQLVACAYKHHAIDARRIYTTGCAVGGLVASAFVLARSSYVAAAAVNSGGLVTEDAAELQDPRRVPAVMTTASTSSLFIVDFNTTSGYLDDLVTRAGGFAVHCRNDTALCGDADNVGQLGWEFMQAHPFGFGDSPYAAGLPRQFPIECQVWPKPTP
jgi:predicted esterase